MVLNKKDFIYLFQTEGKGERKTSMCGSLLHDPSWGPDLDHNPGMCSDWELNQQPVGSKASTQATEPPARIKYTIFYK